MPNDGSDFIHITDKLYYIKTDHDLYFVFEKIEDTNSFWANEFAHHQNKALTTFYNYYQDKEDFKKLENMAWPIFSGGYMAFDLVVRGNFHSKESLAKRNEEVWVAYAYSSFLPPTKAMNKDNVDRVELIFSIVTSPNAPWVTHMGLARSFSYLLNNLIEKTKTPKKNSIGSYPIHANISPRLHAAAGAFMRRRNALRQYMITTPMPEARNLLILSLPTDAIWIGDRDWQSSVKDDTLLNDFCRGKNQGECERRVKTIITRGSPILGFKRLSEKAYEPLFTFSTLLDKNSNRVFTLMDSNESQNLRDFDYRWFFHNRYITPTKDMPFLIVDLSALEQEHENQIRKFREKGQQSTVPVNEIDKSLSYDQFSKEQIRDKLNAMIKNKEFDEQRPDFMPDQNDECRYDASKKNRLNRIEEIKNDVATAIALLNHFSQDLKEDAVKKIRDWQLEALALQLTLESPMIEPFLNTLILKQVSQ